jgi:hypothetical protein
MEEPTRSSLRMYSPRQIYVASFVGGPFAGAWFVSRNYRTLSKSTAAFRSIVVGCIAVIAMVPLILVLPEHFPNLVVPIAYSIAFYYFAKPRFVEDSAMGIAFGRGWRHWVTLIGVSILWLALTFALWIGGLVLLDRVLPGTRPWSP